MHEREGAPPTAFEEYRLIDDLGRGAMGQVYRAQDLLLDRLVAIKFIAAAQPDDRARSLFFKEARAVARLSHPNVVTVYRVGEHRGTPYLVSEYVRGQSLDRVAKPLAAEALLKVALGLARGLAAAHRRGVLHRDLKPANIMLAEDGTVKLLDFGVAKLLPAPGYTTAPEPPPSQRNGQLAVGEDTHPLPDALARTATASETHDDVGSLVAGARAAARRDREHDGARERNGAGREAGPDRDQGQASVGERQGTLDHSARSSRGEGEAHAALPGEGERERSPLNGMRERSPLIGTPLYMAPEIWRGEPATQRSDVYSLGAVLYELAWGQPLYHDATLAELRERVQRGERPSLSQVAPALDRELAALIERALALEPADRFASGEAIREALERRAQAPLGRTIAVPEGNPYRGLAVFEAAHRSLFFGRQGDVGAVVERLRSEAMIWVVGDSGVGKSSLCRAGVLPAIAEGALGGRWALATIRPGRRPVMGLAQAFADLTGAAPATLAAELAVGAVDIAVRQLQARETAVVVFIDQIEELVTLAPTQEAALWAELLASLTARLPRLRILGTLRSDFLTRFSALPGLGEELRQALYLLSPLGPDALREAIVGPAKTTGVRFESEALVDELVQATVHSPGGLPLLQFALAELWDRRDSVHGCLTREAFVALGGVNGRWPGMPMQSSPGCCLKSAAWRDICWVCW